MREIVVVVGGYDVVAEEVAAAAVVGAADNQYCLGCLMNGAVAAGAAPAVVSSYP